MDFQDQPVQKGSLVHQDHQDRQVHQESPDSMEHLDSLVSQEQRVSLDLDYRDFKDNQVLLD